MEQNLTKGDWVRAVVATATAAIAVPVGIAHTAQGSAFVAGLWIVMTPLTLGCVWIVTGRRAWAGYRDRLLVRLLGALAAVVLAVLALAVVDHPGQQAVVGLFALFCATGALMAHHDLPFQRDMAIRGV